VSAALPEVGERWQFRHRQQVGQGLVEVLEVDDTRVRFRYEATRTENATELVFFLRTYVLAPLVSVDGSGS
jgi:hypothetical protein